MEPWYQYRMTRTVLFVFGTRPEAIKLSPLVRRLQARYRVQVCVTAQHRKMLDQVLEVFRIRPDYDLDVMRPAQTLIQSSARILGALEPVIAASRPDLLVVQGDTTTTFCGALAGFYSGVPVAHVEAGLRTGDLRQPFPEEANRLLTSRIAALHFAATQGAADNLAAEGITRNVWVTGNTGVDAVLDVSHRLESGELPAPAVSFLQPDKRLVLVTAHRRESFGPGFEHICEALARIAGRGDVQIVYPVHPNPQVQEPVNRILHEYPNVTLLQPQDYLEFVDLMRRAVLLLTDSGGVQEEGPSLGKPILVLREKTERPEAVAAGTVKLVGTDRDRIVRETFALLDHPEECARMSRIHNPYGDGHASERIEAALHQFWASGAASTGVVA